MRVLSGVEGAHTHARQQCTMPDVNSRESITWVDCEDTIDGDTIDGDTIDGDTIDGGCLVLELPVANSEAYTLKKFASHLLHQFIFIILPNHNINMNIF